MTSGKISTSEVNERMQPDKQGQKSLLRHSGAHAAWRWKHHGIIVYDAEDLTHFFREACITEENGIPYLNTIYKGKMPVKERILKLDAERFQKGELSLSNLLSKYCAYISVNT